MPIHLNNTNKSLLKSFIWLTVKELKIPFMNSFLPSFLPSFKPKMKIDNIKAYSFMNSFFICWNSEKCQWLEFRPLRCLCYSLDGPFSTTQKDKNPKLWVFFFFFGPEFILEHSTLGSSAPQLVVGDWTTTHFYALILGFRSFVAWDLKSKFHLFPFKK